MEGNILAQNITSYTLIAYLDSSRTTDENKPMHVEDKEYTAEFMPIPYTITVESADESQGSVQVEIN